MASNRLRPIPKRMLIHTATYYEKNDQAAGWGGGTAAAVTLDRVRFDPSTGGRTITVDNVAKQTRGTVFLDRRWTTNYKALVIGSRLDVAGVSGIVQDCEPLADLDGGVHHYEVTLV